jgi:hypothetical protein
LVPGELKGIEVVQAPKAIEKDIEYRKPLKALPTESTTEPAQGTTWAWPLLLGPGQGWGFSLEDSQKQCGGSI